MLARLGRVLAWAAYAIASGFMTGAAYFSFVAPRTPETTPIVGFLVAGGVLSFLFGRATLYVLAGE